MADEKFLTIPHLSTATLTRIFSKIAIDHGIGGCWNWTASISSNGYAQVWFREHGRPLMVHRLLYAWLVEPLPLGLSREIPQLDHVCCNKRCCNPSHVRLVTMKQNILRGGSISAVYARRTHCERGHLLPPTKQDRKGRPTRNCRQCRLDGMREWHANHPKQRPNQDQR